MEVRFSCSGRDGYSASPESASSPPSSSFAAAASAAFRAALRAFIAEQAEERWNARQPADAVAAKSQSEADGDDAVDSEQEN